MDALGAVDSPVADTAGRPRTDVSEAIRIARVICIFFMVFVHVHPGTADYAPDAGVRVFDVLRFFVVDSLGRASVALLSVVAGYLAVYSLRREPYATFLHKKTRSLLIPLLLWNAIFIMLVLAGERIHPGYVENSFDSGVKPSTLPELLLGLGGMPANEPLAFLRDIFLCALFTPLLVATARRNTHAFVAVALTLTLLAAFTPFGVRPSIPALYALGVLIAVRRVVPVPDFRLVGVCVLAFVVLGALLTWRDLTSDDGVRSGLTWLEAGFNLVRAPAAVAFWSLAVVLRGSSVGGRLARLEPYIFIAFCIHVIVSKIAWAVWQPVFGGYYDTLYPLFFFAIPVLVVFTAVVGARYLDGRLPGLFALLNGGRGLPSRRKPAVVAGREPGLVVQPARG